MLSACLPLPARPPASARPRAHRKQAASQVLDISFKGPASTHYVGTEVG